MKRVDQLGRAHPLQGLVRVFGCGLGLDEPEAPADAMHVRIHRQYGLVEVKHEHAGGRFRPDADQPAKPRHGFFDGQPGKELQAQPTTLALQLAKNVLDATGFLFGQAATANGELDPRNRRVQAFVP